MHVHTHTQKKLHLPQVTTFIESYVDFKTNKMTQHLGCLIVIYLFYHLQVLKLVCPIRKYEALVEWCTVGIYVGSGGGPVLVYAFSAGIALHVCYL